MARPQPVIVPALKQDLQQTQVDLGLSKLLPILEQFVFKPKRERQEVLGLQKALPGLFKNLSFEEAKAAINSPLFQELAKTQIKQQFAEPKTATDVGGFLRFLGGEQRGERVFPEVEKPAGSLENLLVRGVEAGDFTVEEALEKKKVLTPRQEAFERLTPEEQKQVLLKPETLVTIGTGTKVAIEKEIIEVDKQIARFNRMENLFKPEYLTFQGRSKAWLSKQVDKLGFKTDTEFLQSATKFRNESKATFLAYRKWVTGVAGGEEEMKEIAKAFPDVDRNSPAEYMANLEESRFWARTVSKWLRETRAQGFSLTATREIIEQESNDISGMTDEDIKRTLGIQ